MSAFRSSYSYDLPDDLIASEPAFPRGASRMLALDRETKTIRHQKFNELPLFLEENSLLVVNNTKVIPARLPGVRATGGKLELLLVRPIGTGIWRCKVKNSARIKIGEPLSLCDGQITGHLTQRFKNGDCGIEFDHHDSLLTQLEQHGYAPLPPYIHKVRARQYNRETDLENYQTVFAKQYGAIAAPTAGLHFNASVFEELKGKKIDVVEVTLHVGVGTFEPVRVDDVRQHKMHEEAYSISTEVAAKINHAKSEGRNIVAVGTTVCRTLEAAAVNGVLQPGERSTNLFIYPPYQFQIVDQLVTNFHLPESTLLMLVSAFSDREFMLRAYQEAVNQRYRFFSFGDCMLIQ